MNRSEKSSVIVRLGNQCVEIGVPIARVKGYVAAVELAKIFNACTLAANPRLPALNAQVRDMLRCLETDSGFFRYCNNGLVIAASSVDLNLERDRVELVFDPVESSDSPRGILNGGHTTFACLLFLMQQVAELHGKALGKIRDWDDLVSEWSTWRDEVVEFARGLENPFQVPVEILFPGKGIGTGEFDSLILGIADARNNNCQLTDETKANFVGMYEELKLAMPSDQLRQRVEWRTNTPGTQIRAKDILALACIPLRTAAEELHDLDIHDFPNRLDLKQVYNGTAKCADYFHRIYRAVSKPVGNSYQLEGENGKLIASAIACTREIIECYDWLEQNFPTAYNDAGGRFGALEKCGLRQADGREYLTKYFGEPIEVKFSDALFIPILVGLGRLLKIENGELLWKVEPLEFLKRNLSKLLRTYKGTLKDNDNDSRLLARSETAYSLVNEMFGMFLEFEALSTPA